ncbi:chloride channel protein 2 [Lingula anatina]|uniref:Chloride channel protein n=1 Tax=Lingula anatina TaxID=7574 RepID=A0A1S3HJS7_LINAN|nr:chloride channel protein 2 [Lingula anatina]|eukprot:XP_013386272.1 chloride channel protein 2 [Lingula anatina]
MEECPENMPSPPPYSEAVLEEAGEPLARHEAEVSQQGISADSGSSCDKTLSEDNSTVHSEAKSPKAAYRPADCVSTSNDMVSGGGVSPTCSETGAGCHLYPPPKIAPKKKKPFLSLGSSGRSKDSRRVTNLSLQIPQDTLSMLDKDKKESPRLVNSPVLLSPTLTFPAESPVQTDPVMTGEISEGSTSKQSCSVPGGGILQTKLPSGGENYPFSPTCIRRSPTREIVPLTRRRSGSPFLCMGDNIPDIPEDSPLVTVHGGEMNTAPSRSPSPSPVGLTPFSPLRRVSLPCAPPLRRTMSPTSRSPSPDMWLSGQPVYPDSRKSSFSTLPPSLPSVKSPTGCTMGINRLMPPGGRDLKSSGIRRNSSSIFEYVSSLMYGRYTQDLGEYAKHEAVRIKRLQEHRRKAEERLQAPKGFYIYTDNICFHKCRGFCLWFRSTVIQRLGEDWVFLALLGVVMAILSFAMDWVIERCQHAHIWLYKELGEYPPLQFFAWVLYPIAFILFSTGFVHIVAPNAIGSGIPEMKTILRGVVLKEYLTLKTLVSKVVGLCSSLGSRLPIGKEGPFVHVASIVATLLSKLMAFRGIYDNESRNYEMLAAACAVGVACTFAAPIGGVLFSIEVTSVYFAVRNYWRGFFSAVCGAAVFRLLAIWVQEEETITALFKTSLRQEFPFDAVELLAFGTIGLVCGFGGALFIYFHRKIIHFIRKQRKLSSFLQKNEVSWGVGVLSFPLGLGQYTAGMLTHREAVNELFSNFTWSTGKAENLDLDQLEVLSHWNHPDTSVYVTLTLFIIIQFVTAALAGSLPIPAGVFIPVFTIGAAFGRLVGECLATWFPSGVRMGEQVSPIVPGGYAVVVQIIFDIIPTKSSPYYVLEKDFMPYIYVWCLCSTYNVFVEDFMIRDIRFISYIATYQDVKNLLETSKLRTFPLVDAPESMILLGSVQRLELELLLEAQLGRQRRLAAVEEALHKRQQEEEERKRAKEQLEKRPPEHTANGDTLKPHKYTKAPQRGILKKSPRPSPRASPRASPKGSPNVWCLCSTYNVFVEDFMIRDIRFISYIATYQDVKNLLETSKLRTFPLVDAPESMILLGSVQRLELELLLEAQLGRQRRLAAVEEALHKRQQEEEERKRAKEQLEKRASQGDTEGTRPMAACSGDMLNAVKVHRQPSARFTVTPAASKVDSGGQVQLKLDSTPPEHTANGDTLKPHKYTKAPQRGILKKSPRPSPRASPRASPKGSPQSSPRSSPPGSAKTSPTPSPQLEKKFSIGLAKIFKSRSKESIADSTASEDDEAQRSLLDGFPEQYTDSVRSGKSVQFNVMDLQEQRQWEEEQLKCQVKFEEAQIDPAPFQLVERTSLQKVHSLFSLLGLNHAYVTNTGRLVGVVALKEVRRAIEGQVEEDHELMRTHKRGSTVELEMEVRERSDSEA